MENKITLPIGMSNFTEIRKNHYYYIDKTGLIENLLQNNLSKGTLITRPRRFGKTLAMCMLADFFDIRKDSRALFDGLYIAGNKSLCAEWMNQCPVIFLTLKNIDGLKFESAYDMLTAELADLFKQHSYLLDLDQMDASDRLVVHPDLGLGICEISGQPRVKKNSVFRSEIADRIRRENLGEELRILYVALTRAKEKLVLTGMIKDAQKTFSGYTGNVLPGKPVSYRQRVRAGSYLDWILPAMLSYPQKYTLDVVPPEKIVWEEVEQAADSRENYEELLQHIDHAKPELLQQYDQWFSYRYPYQSEAGKKSKYSVSELKHASLVLQYDRSEGQAVVPDFLQEDRNVYVPDFAREEDREYPAAENVNQGAMRGTAVHRVMECLDFAAIADIDTSDAGAVSAFVKQELDRMLANGQLPGEWYALVIPEMIEAFVESPIAPRMAAAAVRGDLYRERPFVMQHQMEASGGTVLVQGIIDVFWMENDKIILLDYKTDRVKQAQELLMRYQTQLQLYADALSRVFSTDTKKMVAEEKLIYSFHLKEVVTL